MPLTAELTLRAGPLGPVAHARAAAPASSLAGDVKPASGAMLRPGPGKDDVYKEFEAFVLQSFIEAMLPKDAENVYGKGTAGQIWKSMLAEKLAAQMAQRGDLGIADYITRNRGAMRSGGELARPAIAAPVVAARVTSVLGTIESRPGDE